MHFLGQRNLIVASEILVWGEHCAYFLVIMITSTMLKVELMTRFKPGSPAHRQEECEFGIMFETEGLNAKYNYAHHGMRSTLHSMDMYLCIKFRRKLRCVRGLKAYVYMLHECMIFDEIDRG